MCKTCEKIEDAKTPLAPRMVMFHLMGKFFGYPDCCIKAFIDRANKLDKAFATNDLQQINEASKVTPIQEGYIHGFIPCISCAATIKPRKEYRLIKNRVCKTPYPIDNYTDEEFQNFINKFY